MVDTKISALTSITGANVASGDLVDIVDISDTSMAASGTDKKITATELSNAIILLGSLATDAELATHVAAADPHVGYVLESLYDANTVLAATADNTPAILTVAVDTVVGRITGGAIASLYAYGFPVLINAQTGTTYTTVLADVGKVITVSNAAAHTLTIPLNATVAYSLGSVITIEQKGAGQVTIAPTGGVTLNTAASLKTRTQFSVVQLRKDLTDTWTVCGDLEPLGQAMNAQTGTTYTLVIGDAYKYITLSNASSITLTVPPNSSVPFPIGTRIDLEQIGAGQVTVAQGAGVTINNTPGLKCRAQYSSASLIKKGTDLWSLAGDIAA